MRKAWLFLSDIIQRRYLWILAVALVVTPVLALGIPRIRFKTGQDTLVSSSSRVYQDNLRYQERFGGDPMLVLFEGDVRRLLSPPNVDTLSRLEANLKGREDVASVISPLTVVQLAADQFSLQQELALSALAGRQEQAARAAREGAAAQGLPPEAQEQAAQQASDAVGAEFAQQRQADALRLASVGELSLNNPAFADFIMFDEKGDVRPELRNIITDPQDALMVVRLGGNMSIDEQAAAAGQIVKIVQATKFEGWMSCPPGRPCSSKRSTTACGTAW